MDLWTVFIYLGCINLLLMLEQSGVVAQTNINLPLGNVLGKLCPNERSTVNQFLGIPYAVPPTGDLRFRPPVPYNRTYPIPALNATAQPTPCIQLANTPMSEDCLYLNVFVPANASSPLPVRVFLHGGGFFSGSISQPLFDGCRSTSTSGTVLVTVQYRLASLGFMAHSATFNESGLTGNWGLMDQQLALRWVKDNIKAFGGDPNSVLLSGQSAGGQAVFIHYTLASSEGLFNAALSQSGTALRLQNLTEALDSTENYMKILNCSTGAPAAQLACLRSKPAMQLLLSIPLPSVYTYKPPGLLWPVVDGTFLAKAPLDSIASGEFQKRPYFIGSNANEGRLRTLLSYPRTFGNLTQKDVEAYVQSFPSDQASTIVQQYNASSFEGYTNTAFEQISAIYGDANLACPTFSAAFLLARQGAPVYRYYFKRTPPCPYADFARDMKTVAVLGATHTSELYYAFGITDNLPRPTGNCTFPSEDALLSERMMKIWGSFSRAPAFRPSFANGTDWPLYNAATHNVVDLDVPELQAAVRDWQSTCKVFGYDREPVAQSDGFILTPARLLVFLFLGVVLFI